MIKKIYLSLVLICCMFISQYTLGQVASGDTSIQKRALANIADDYNNAIGQQSRLYNGPEYDLYNPNIKGNAYFNDINTFVSGTVTYDGIFYKDVPMMYDINRDVVAVRLYNKFSIFSLLNERVQSFDWLNHHFVYLKTDSLSTGLNTGFYDQLYSGNLEVLVKHLKNIQNTSGITTIETYFTTLSPRFFLKKGNNYYNVGSQETLLNILKDKKKELQQYIKASQIKFKKTPAEAIVAIAAKYDELSK